MYVCMYVSLKPTKSACFGGCQIPHEKRSVFDHQFNFLRFVRGGTSRSLARRQTCMYVCLSSRPTLSMYVCTSDRPKQVCMYVCMLEAPAEHVCMYVCMYVSNIHTYTFRFCVKSSLQHVCMSEILVFCHDNETYIHA